MTPQVMQGRYAIVNTQLDTTDVTLIEAMNGRQGDNGRLIYFSLKDGILPHNLTQQDVAIVVKDSAGKIKIVTGIKDRLDDQAGLFNMLIPAEFYQAAGDVEAAYLQVTDDNKTVISSIPITFTVVANNILLTANASNDYIDSVQQAINQANKLIAGLKDNIAAQSQAYQALQAALATLTGQINDKQVALKNVANTFTAVNTFTKPIVADITGNAVSANQANSANYLVATPVADGTDFNTLTEAGYYQASGAFVNAPNSDANQYTLFVEKTPSNNWIIQKISLFTETSVKAYIRGCVDNQWQAWQQIDTGIKDNQISEISVLGNLMLRFHETIAGVEVSISGTIKNTKTAWDWVDLGEKIPDDITKPDYPVIVTMSGNSGVAGVTVRMPLSIIFSFNPDGHIAYKIFNLDNNNWDAQQYDVVTLDGYHSWLK